MSAVVFDRLVRGRARVVIYQHRERVSEFQVAKTFKDVKGHFRCTYKYYQRKAAAVRYAERWLADRVGEEVRR